MSLATAPYRGLFARFGQMSRIDPRLLEAQAMVESSGKTHAFRYEPALQDASYGLMQVLGRTARKLGLPADEPEASLCDPERGILYGAKALMDICAWVGGGCAMERANGGFDRVSLPLPANLRTVLARYNGGGKGNPNADGSLRNDDYVVRVETFFQAVLKETG